MKIDGGCHCGYITYVAEIDPDKVGICHCTDCQTLWVPPFAPVFLQQGTGLAYMAANQRSM
jgi:hypothetical protein